MSHERADCCRRSGQCFFLNDIWISSTSSADASIPLRSPGFLESMFDAQRFSVLMGESCQAISPPSGLPKEVTSTAAT